MFCCINTNLCFAQFMEKKKSFNTWFKKRFNRNQVKLNEKESINFNLEESKYIKRIPKCIFNENLNKNPYSDLDKRNELPNEMVKDSKSLKSKNSFKESLNNEWEIFFTSNDDKTNEELNQRLNEDKLNDKISFKNLNERSNKIVDQNLNDFSEKNEYKFIKLGIENLELSDLEWDDFSSDEKAILTYDEQDQLIQEK